MAFQEDAQSPEQRARAADVQAAIELHSLLKQLRQLAFQYLDLASRPGTHSREVQPEVLLKHVQEFAARQARLAQERVA